MHQWTFVRETAAVCGEVATHVCGMRTQSRALALGCDQHLLQEMMEK
jgi:hypothetical protein